MNETRIRVKQDYYAPKLRGLEGTILRRLGGSDTIIIAMLDGYAPRGNGPNKDERAFTKHDFEVI